MNKIIKWKKNMYIEKRHLYKNKCFYQNTLNHAKLNRVMLKKCDVKEMSTLLKMIRYARNNKQLIKLFIIYYLLFILNVHDYKKNLYFIFIVKIKQYNLIFEKL